MKKIKKRSQRGRGGVQVSHEAGTAPLTCRFLVAEKWSHGLELVQKCLRAGYVGWRNVPVADQHPIVVERAVLTVFPVIVRALIPVDRLATGGSQDRGGCCLFGYLFGFLGFPALRLYLSLTFWCRALVKKDGSEECDVAGEWGCENI